VNVSPPLSFPFGLQSRVNHDLGRQRSVLHPTGDSWPTPPSPPPFCDIPIEKRSSLPRRRRRDNRAGIFLCSLRLSTDHEVLCNSSHGRARPFPCPRFLASSARAFFSQYISSLFFFPRLFNSGKMRAPLPLPFELKELPPSGRSSSELRPRFSAIPFSQTGVLSGDSRSVLGAFP